MQDLEYIVSLDGLIGPNPKDLLRTVMKTASDNLQVPLMEMSEEQVLMSAGWCMLSEPGTDQPTGRIKIRLSSIGQARQLQDCLQSSRVMLGGKILTVDEENSVLHRIGAQTLWVCFQRYSLFV